jgi:branched-subunit amino acid aminotransferase/4-amino-4-deoxychorismate lyase
VSPSGPQIALSETCRVVAGRVPLWPYHRARLIAGGCDPGTIADAEHLVAEAAAEWDGAASSRVRLSLTVAPGGHCAIGVSQRLSSLDVPGGPVAVRVNVADLPPLPLGAAKPAERAWWDEAQRRARFAGGHQAIIVGEDGRVVDGGSASVWIAEGAKLVTPPAPPAIAGVARAFLLDAAAAEGIRVRVETISWERFESGDEAFLTNAFGGLAIIRGRSGCVASAAAAIFDAMWRASA